jgi:CheY-like chemotaxis protein
VALDGTHLTVLLVEDDLDGRRMYATWLTDAGFQVLQAHNGLQALERAFDSTPDVVVTDLASMDSSSPGACGGIRGRARCQCSR